MSVRPTTRVAQRKRNLTRKKIAPKVAKAKGLKRESKSRREASPQAKAVVALAPCYNAATLVDAFTHGTFGKIDWLAAAKELSNRCSHVRGNQTGRMEDMLMAQAHSLDVMFASLARRAGKNIESGEVRFLNAADTYMRLALRAQNQCRMTLETLATIKNPPVVFAKQANIAHGHQQVNNGEAGPGARVEIQKPQFEQSRLIHDERQSLDFGAPAHAIGSDTALATVEEIHGAEKRSR